MRPEWSELEANVAAAAAWLASPDQPRGAMVSHFGFSEHCGGMLTIQVSATGWNGGPGGERGSPSSCVFVFNNSTSDPDDEEQPVFTAAEMDEIGALLEANGITVNSHWNGAGFHSGSFGCTAKVSAAVKRIHRRYSEGCPKPGHSVFCGGRAEWMMVKDEQGRWCHREFNGSPGRLASEAEIEKVECDWSEGFKKANPPAWVAVSWPVPAAGEAPTPEDDDRNLEAVRRALAKLGPLLVEMGHHHATINAGRRGHIDETDDGLRFVADDGHGVCIPAEAAEALVSLAVLGGELESNTR